MINPANCNDNKSSNSAKWSDFAQHFFEDREELIQKIDKFKARRNLKNVFRTLEKDHNDINFFSWLSEMRVGLYLDQFCQEMIYDGSFFGKTPDWRLKINNQSIIAEVLRLNASENETRAEIARSKAIRAFQALNPGEASPIYGGRGVYNSEYFYGSQSKLEDKVNKHKDLLEKHQMPFILCITPDFNTKIDHIDTFDFLIANNKKGHFYENKVFGKYTSGVLLNTYWGQWYYFSNENAKFPLTRENSDLLTNAK